MRDHFERIATFIGGDEDNAPFGGFTLGMTMDEVRKLGGDEIDTEEEYREYKEVGSRRGMSYEYFHEPIEEEDGAEDEPNERLYVTFWGQEDFASEVSFLFESQNHERTQTLAKCVHDRLDARFDRPKIEKSGKERVRTYAIGNDIQIVTTVYTQRGVQWPRRPERIFKAVLKTA